MAKQSTSVFWIKHIVLAIVVISAAIFVLEYEPGLKDSSIASSAQSKEQQASIRSNLTKFYKEFRMSSRDPIAEMYGDYVIPLEMKSESVAQQLIKMGNVSFPPQSNFKGEQKVRAFPKDSTLKTESSKYVEEEGLTLIWDLNQDFIIRDRFQSYNTLLGTMDEISGAIDTNFPGDVQVYMCPKKRALVMTSKPHQYLTEQCKQTSVSNF